MLAPDGTPVTEMGPNFFTVQYIPSYRDIPWLCLMNQMRNSLL
jgi:hypothetical protein